MKNLESIRLFLAVAEESGFAAGARRLGLSPAAATRAVTALESELGTRLFRRSTRRVALTEAGARFVVHAQRIVAAVDSAVEDLGEHGDVPAGRLRVVCRSGIARHIVMPEIAAFRRRYPDVTIGLEVTESHRIDPTESGCDLAIAFGHLGDSAMVQRRIAETDSVLVASTQYVARRGVPQVPDELEHHDCVTIRAETGRATWRFSRDGTEHRVRLRAAVAVSDPDGLMTCARAGLGIAMVSDWLAADDIERGLLTPLLTDYQIEPRGSPITALYPSRVHLPARARVFVDFLVERCAERLVTPSSTARFAPARR